MSSTDPHRLIVVQFLRHESVVARSLLVAYLALIFFVRGAPNVHLGDITRQGVFRRRGFRDFRTALVACLTRLLRSFGASLTADRNTQVHTEPTSSPVAFPHPQRILYISNHTIGGDTILTRPETAAPHPMLEQNPM